jgi:hypothetical protein
LSAVEISRAHLVALRTFIGEHSSFRTVKWLLNILKGKWLGHPLHPILVHVPMAMWPGALIFDLLSKWQIGGNAMVRLSFYAIAFGLIASLLAAPAGLVDWTGIKKGKTAVEDRFVSFGAERGRYRALCDQPRSAPPGFS